MGVVIPNSLGIGGGCLMTLYDRKRGKAVVIDGRETAPSYAEENMFANNLLSSRGPLSMGVPGELAAYWEAHQRYGKLNWSELFDDSIRMANDGVQVVEHLADSLVTPEHAKHISASLGTIFMHPTEERYLKEDEILVQKQLAKTLRRIRDFGAKEFYEGETGKLFIEDLQAQGGKMTLEDLANYTAQVREPLVFELAPDMILHTAPPPGSGIILSVVLRILAEFGYLNPSPELDPHRSQEAANLYYHRLVEAFKFAYAKRAGLEDLPFDEERMERLMNQLHSGEYIRRSAARIDGYAHDDNRYGGDKYFQDDHGTAHVSVMDAEGNAAAVTTSINLYFGSGLWSQRTGIIYNDVMDDFVSPSIVNMFGQAPSKYNHIRPGRRPLSSMAPAIYTDAKGNARLIIGGSGGTKITTAIASVSLRNLYFGEDIKTAIDGPRLHHQYLPMAVQFEKNFPKVILQSLMDRGHELKPILGRSSVIMAIAASHQPDGTKCITANSDYRKGGSVAGS